MMMMRTAPRGNRLHIAFFGRRNVGKSSLVNALAGQPVSIVSETAGTTTDPVEKAMELLPIGPVLLIDTAGLDDEGALGEQRIDRARKVIDRTDLAVLVAEAGEWTDFEQRLLDELIERETAVVVAFNKSDRDEPAAPLIERLKKTKIRHVRTVANEREGVVELRAAMIRSVPESFIDPPPLVGDLVPSGELAVLVVPLDMEAPKGRLILPQVQTIRDLLDSDAWCMVVKERELRDAIDRLNRPPALVITDSQAFLKVGADTPDHVPMTSFSILMARQKGDLTELVRGATAIERLGSGSRVLVCEACTHHPIGDDIGTVKIPRWLTQYAGGKVDFEHYRGHAFPESLEDVDLVIHCGGCVHNRREMLTRIMRCREANVPITNYGLAIAYALGIFERALGPFPAALEAYRASLRSETVQG